MWYIDGITNINVTTEVNINNIMNEICSIRLQDNVALEVKDISLIREDDI